MSCYLQLLIEGTIGNFIPTLIGAFLGFFLGIMYHNHKETSSYKKQLDLAFIELTINVEQLKTLINFINTKKQTPQIYTSKEFLEINIWKNPIYNSAILDLKFLTEITEVELAASFYQKVKNSEVFYNSIKFQIYTDYESIIKAMNSLIESYCEIAWNIYIIVSRNNLEFNQSNCSVSDDFGHLTALSKLWFNRYYTGGKEPWQEEKMKPQNRS